MFHTLKYIHRDAYHVSDAKIQQKIREKNTVEDRLDVKREMLLNDAVEWGSEVTKVLKEVGQLAMDFYGSKLPIFQYISDIDDNERVNISAEVEAFLGKEYTVALKSRDEARDKSDLKYVRQCLYS